MVPRTGEALRECRRCAQQHLEGRPVSLGDPLYTARRTLHKGTDLPTERQWDRLQRLFVDQANLEVEITWGVNQAMITAYRVQDRMQARTLGLLRPAPHLQQPPPKRSTAGVLSRSEG